MYFQMFRQSASALLERSHPNIVRVLAVGRTPLHFPYLITEYFSGVAIHASTTPKWNPQQISTIVYQLLHTALYLNEAESSEPYFTPHDILLDPQGNVKIKKVGLDRILRQMEDALGLDVWSVHAELDCPKEH